MNLGGLGRKFCWDASYQLGQANKKGAALAPLSCLSELALRRLFVLVTRLWQVKEAVCIREIIIAAWIFF